MRPPKRYDFIEDFAAVKRRLRHIEITMRPGVPTGGAANQDSTYWQRVKYAAPTVTFGGSVVPGLNSTDKTLFTADGSNFDTHPQIMDVYCVLPGQDSFSQATTYTATLALSGNIVQATPAPVVITRTAGAKPATWVPLFTGLIVPPGSGGASGSGLTVTVKGKSASGTTLIQSADKLEYLLCARRGPSTAEGPLSAGVSASWRSGSA